MLKHVLYGFTAAAVLAMGPAGMKDASAETYNLRYSDIGPPRGPRAAALKWWASELDKRSGGQLKIKFFWSQSLVKGKATLKAVGSGLADMGTIMGLYTPADLPIWNYSNTPFLIGDAWVGMRTWHEMRQKLPELRNETQKKNVKILFNNTTGPVQILGVNEPITSVADFKGKKIRASGGFTHLFKDLGAVPVKIGFGELYAAMDRGTVDATINYTPFVKSYKHYEVAKHVTIADMGQILGYGGGINLKLFNKMSKKLQDVLVKASDEFHDVYAKNYITGSDQAKKDMIAGIDGKKVQFHVLSAKERGKWAAAAGRFTTEWLAKMESKGVDAAKIIGTFTETRRKYQNELKTKGYPWAR